MPFGVSSFLRSLVSTSFHRSHMESETAEELRLHIENRADDLERSGLARVEAVRRTRIEFVAGNASRRNAARNVAASRSKRYGPI